jgi:transposase
MFNLVNFMLFQHIRISSSSGRAILLRLANGVSAHQAIAQGWLGLRDKEARISELCQIVPDEPLPDWLQELAKGWVTEIDYHSTAIEKLEDYAVKRGIETYPSQINLLTSIPQISVSLAVRLVAEMGPDFHIRYDSAKAFARALGVAPRHHITGGSIKEKQINRTGNSYVKRHLFLAVSAYYARSNDRERDRLNAFIQRYRDRGGPYRAAIMAGCNKLAKYTYAMMKNGEFYRPSNLPTEAENGEKGQISQNGT